MAASLSSNTHFSILTTLLILLTAASVASAAEDSQCGAETASGCNDKSGALSLKLIATFSILVASVIGVCIPLFTRSVPALNPERSPFVIVKAFASGIILATGFTHVLPDSFDMLSSSCLADNPWHKFPFTGFVAMLSALATLLVDSVATSNNTCTIKGLVAALCFHQMFEGMGLGGCILQAEYTLVKKAIMAFFFATTTPFGILVGIGMSKTYKENSPTALITVGLLNASSAGLLIYMALVDLLAVEFMGPKLQASIRLQIKSFVAVLLGAGGMSVMAKWA
ncbi:Probable zinc transporter 10 [Linum perenne]